MSNDFIDWSRIDELRDEMGEDDVIEIAALFVDEVSDGVAALDSSDPQRLAEQLHAVRGAALNLGFSRLAALAGSGEAEPGSADLAELRACCDTSIAALQERLPGLG